jgi:hypothetical protein
MRMTRPRTILFIYQISKEARAGRLRGWAIFGIYEKLGTSYPCQVVEEALRLHHTGPPATNYQD